MTKTLNVVMIAAVTAAVAGAAFAQTGSADTMKKDDHMATDAMMPGKKDAQMGSGAMASGQKDDHMKSEAMAAGDKMKAKKKKDDHMAAGALPATPK